MQAIRLASRARLGAVLALGVVLVQAPQPALAVFAQWQIDVGYDRLANLLGSSVPNGAGVAISLVEGEEHIGGVNTHRYLPEFLNPEFLAATDPLGQAVSFINAGDLESWEASGHATGMGRHIFGNTTGLAKAANQVTVYDADSWIANILHATEPSMEPVAQPFKVQNHSWAGTYGDITHDASALRRFDYLIETGEMTAVVGTSNNASPGTAFPNPALAHANLLAHSYNAIVAGRSDARHSRGATGTVYGQGRFRPDLVAPAGSSSLAAAQISSAAAILRGAAAGTDADRAETTKAILMAGATKKQFANYVEPTTGTPNPWDNTPTRPLDDIFGAGQLNVFNSHQILAGGQHAGTTTQPASSMPLNGWDYQNHKANPSIGDIYYNFVVPAGKTEELSAVLAWNVKIYDSSPAPTLFAPIEDLKNLDLFLYNSTSSFLGTEIKSSISTVDNVEHIYAPTLGPGTYTLKVTGAASWDYALAWRLVDHSGDFNNDGVVDLADYVVWRKGFGTLYTQDDYDDWRLNFTGAPAVGLGTGVALGQVASVVPEPTTLALIVASLSMFLTRRRPRATTVCHC